MLVNRFPAKPSMPGLAAQCKQNAGNQFPENDEWIYEKPDNQQAGH